MAKKRNKVQTSPQNIEKLNLSFSFQYYDTSEKNKYCLSEWSQADIKHTLSRFKDICTKSLAEVLNDRHAYHFYETVWEKTIFPNGFTNPNNSLNTLDPFHFSIVGLNNQKARVFGALSRSTFYIVWFDYEHEILPTPLRNT